MDPKIYDYIRRRREEGKSDEEIRLTLISLGFPRENVELAFQESASATKRFRKEDIIHSLILLILIVVFSVVHYYVTNLLLKN